MPVPSLHSEQQRFPKVPTKMHHTFTAPTSLTPTVSIINIMKSFWGLFLPFTPGPCPWLRTLRIHTHTQPTAIRALSRQPDDDVNTLCFIGFHYIQETQGPTGPQTCYARPPSGRSLAIYPNCPYSRKTPGPCVACAPTPGLSGACSHWISGELEGGEPPRLRHCYCSEKN